MTDRTEGALDTSETRKQQDTSRLIALIHKELRAHHEHWLINDRRIETRFLCDDLPLQLWRVQIYERDDIEGKHEVKAWAFYWDGSEFTSYDHTYQAVKEFVAAVKQRRLETNWATWFSPTSISGYIALLLIFLLGALLLLGFDVPQPLWPIVSAVIAFYFGRQSSTRPNSEAR
ncbi:MAG: hypothetical protein ACK5WN_14025 [Alphaproteobacteria bacterium]|jgi:hypothetical protein